MTDLIVGERRSPKAIKLGLTWADGGLAAKPLFEALRAVGIDPRECRFVNWFEDGQEMVRLHQGRVIALGQKVHRALTAEGITHIALIHPAARGNIRLRANYVAHVVERLSKSAFP